MVIFKMQIIIDNFIKTTNKINNNNNFFLK